MTGVRAATALMLVGALALVLASCGGGDSSSNGKSSTVQSGATASGPGAAGGSASDGRSKGGSSGTSNAQGATGGSSGGEQRPSARARQRSKALSRRPVLRNTFRGTANVVYHEARGRCLVVPTATLRRAYHASSSDPAAIARAYAEREAPIPAYRKPAAAGCLDGINSRQR